MPGLVTSRHTAEDMLRHQELQRRSGLSIDAYCKREHISPSSWWYWRKRLDLLTRRSNSSISPVSFLQLPVQTPEQRLELILPNGSRISIPASCDPAIVRHAVGILSGLRPR